MNKLFSSIVIMCASLGISTGYSINRAQVPPKVLVSDKIIPTKVLSILKKLRRLDKLTTPSRTKICSNNNEKKIEYTIPKGVPNPNYDEKIKMLIEEHAFKNLNNKPDDIINECSNILYILNKNTSNPKHLQTSSRFITSIVVPDRKGSFFNYDKSLPCQDRIRFFINDVEHGYWIEELRQYAYSCGSFMFDEIIKNPNISYETEDSSGRYVLLKETNRTKVLQTLARDLCRLVGLSLMLWYNDNPDSKLVLSTSEG